MAHKLFKAKGVIADGDFTLEGLTGKYMGPQWKGAVISVTLYDDDTYTNPVNATAGTLTITGSEDGFNYGTIQDGVIDLTTGEYDRPFFNAYATDVKGVWSGVTGTATHFIFRVWRSTN